MFATNSKETLEAALTATGMATGRRAADGPTTVEPDRAGGDVDGWPPVGPFHLIGRDLALAPSADTRIVYDRDSSVA